MPDYEIANRLTIGICLQCGAEYDLPQTLNQSLNKHDKKDEKKVVMR